MTQEVILSGRDAVFATAANADILLLDGTDDPVVTLARAAGMVATGCRVAVWLQGRKAGLITEQLLDLVSRNLPVVIHLVIGPYPDHAGGTDHALYHRLADSGAFAVFSRSVPHAVALTLTAQRVAERGLLPCIVAHDGPETAFAPTNVCIPQAEFCRRLLRDMPEEPAGPAQELLFGSRRPPIPAWFDMARPVATGWSREAGELASMGAGFRLFFADHMAGLLQEVLAEVHLVAEHAPEPVTAPSQNVAFVLIAQGAAVGAAETAAKHLRVRYGWDIGVVGLSWSRPLLTQRIKKVLADARVVTFLERLGVSAGPGPLQRELSGCLPPTCAVVSAIWDPAQDLSMQRLAAIFRNATLAARARVFPGMMPWNPDVAHFPKREAAHQALLREYPDLEQVTLPGVDHLEVLPEHAKRLALFLRRDQGSLETVNHIAQAFAKAAGPYVRTTLRPCGNGILSYLLTACTQPLADPAAGEPVHCALVGDLDVPMNPFRQVMAGGVLVFACKRAPEDFTALLSTSWLAGLREGTHSCFLFQGEPADFTRVAVDAAMGKVQPDLIPLPIKRRVDHPMPVSGNPLPHQRRLTLNERTYDNLPRFWGEILQPRLAGHAVPDIEPLSALGKVPSGSAAITNRARTRDIDIQFQPERCIGCGVCWTACPDAAVDVTALPVKTMLTAITPSGPLQRLAPRLALQVTSLLKKQKTWNADVLNEAYTSVCKTMPIADRDALDDAWATACETLLELPLAVTETLFYQEESLQKGSGHLLFLGIDPTRCQGCGICTVVCEQEALTQVERRFDMLPVAMEMHRHFEELPDTPGASIDHWLETGVLEQPAATFLSRHCAKALPGGTAAPGSAARLALRHACAAAEFVAQPRQLNYLAVLDALIDNLHRQVLDNVTKTLTGNDSQHLAQVLQEMGQERITMAQLGQRLTQMGAVAALDAAGTNGLTELGHQLESLRHALLVGHTGNGRARYGLVLAARQTRDLARYPYNAFTVPVIANHGGNGPATAVGLADGLMRKHLKEIRKVRLAQTALRKGWSAARHLVPQDLNWDQLTTVEKGLCPRVLLVVDESALSAGKLDPVLSAGLPLTVLVLASWRSVVHDPDPMSVTTNYPKVPLWVTSLNRRDHLGKALEAACSTQGPAVVHLYIPDCRRDGFDEGQLFPILDAAVEAGLQPIYHYDAQVEKAFGLRFCLTEVGQKPLQHWAGRLGSHGDENLEAMQQACDARRQFLLALSGKDSPFVQRIREEITHDLEVVWRQRMADLQQQMETDQQERDRRQREALSAQLSERLFSLVQQNRKSEGDP